MHINLLKQWHPQSCEALVGVVPEGGEIEGPDGDLEGFYPEPAVEGQSIAVSTMIKSQYLPLAEQEQFQQLVDDFSQVFCD